MESSWLITVVCLIFATAIICCAQGLEKGGVKFCSVERISRCWINTSTQLLMAIQESITSKLSKEFEPVHLDVINESYMHNVPKGSETHFKVVIVSDQFEGKSLIQRHRSVNELLKDELASGVHALSIQAKTSQQWETSGHSVYKSPPCMGGSGK